MIRALFVALAASLVTACSAALPSGGPAPLGHQARTSSATPLMYVLKTSSAAPELDEIPVGSTQPLRTIGNLTNLRGFALGGTGTAFLLMAGAGRPHVDEYDAGAVAPSRTILRGIHDPTFIRLDEAGNLYAIDGRRTVVKYAAGSVEPALTIPLHHCGGLLSAISIAIDPFGTIYVSCGKLMSRERQTIDEYDASSSVARTIHVPSARHVLNLLADPSGRLYAEYVSETQKFVAGTFVYDRGHVDPTRSFPLPTTAGVAPLFYDRLTGNVLESPGGCYSVNGGPWICTSRIYAIDAATGAVVTTIAPPAKSVFGLPSLDAAGNLYAGLLAVVRKTTSVREYPQAQASGWRSILSGTGLYLLGVWPSGILRTAVPAPQGGFDATAPRGAASCDANGDCYALRAGSSQH